MFLASALVSVVISAISLVGSAHAAVGSAHAAGDAAGSMHLTGSTAAVNGAAAPQERHSTSYACSFVYGHMTRCPTTINVEPRENLYAENNV